MKELIEIQQELKAPKNQRNTFGKYNYRNCEDILEAVKPLLKRYGCLLTLTDEVVEVGSIIYITAHATIKKGDEFVHVKAQAGIDPNRKGMDISQSFGSSSSYARKYALNGLFLIDDTKDADATNTHDKLEYKPNMVLNSKEFNSAKQWLNEGGKIEQVKQKYSLTKEVENKLLE